MLFPGCRRQCLSGDETKVSIWQFCVPKRMTKSCFTLIKQPTGPSINHSSKQTQHRGQLLINRQMTFPKSQGKKLSLCLCGHRKVYKSCRIKLSQSPGDRFNTVYMVKTDWLTQNQRGCLNTTL